MNNEGLPFAATGHPSAPSARFVPTDDQIAKARKWFAHAKKSTETRNFEYAIELYASGLALWPTALDEGLKPLRLAAVARRQTGGKPPGFIAARKYPINPKEPLKSLTSAFHLFGLDPSHLAYIEQLLHLAARAGCDITVQFIAPVLVDALSSAKKLAESHYESACRSMDLAAELAAKFDQDPVAIDILNACISTSQIWHHHYPDSAPAQRARSDATGRLTILKGRFAKGEDFTGSLKDGEKQYDLLDAERPVNAPERTDELIDRARKDWLANPAVPNKLLTLVDRLCRAEDPVREREAVDLLEKEFAATNNYIFKAKADDVRSRAHGRTLRDLRDRLKADPQNAELQSAAARAHDDLLQTETAILRERMAHYPTDLRIRYQLARRLFEAKQFDEAIPLLQQSKLDARCEMESRLFLGRCFLEKGFIDQAVSILRAAVDELESNTSDLALHLNYWLARSFQAAHQSADAKRVYGQLIQFDYNFLDARQRLESLVAGDKA